jgi:hypothetical protein
MASAYRGDTFRAMATRRILTLTLWCTALVAQASPRTDPTAGRAVFTGATTPHATSIGLDPAALGLGQFDEVYVALTGVIDQLQIDLDPFATADLSAPGARVRDTELSPGAMLAFIYHFAGNLTLGFEARSNPPETFPSDRSALRYHTLGNGERDWLASVGGSIKVTNELFFGAGVSHQNTFLRLRYARDTALARGRGAGGITSDCGGAPCGLGNPQATELYDIDVRSPTLSTSNLRVNIGGIYELSRDLWLAVAYHTPPGFAVQSELSGHVTVDRAPRDVARDGGADPVLHGQSVVEIQFPASVDAELRARLPHQLDLHVGGRWEDLSRLSAYDVRTFGTTLPGHGIPEWTQRPRGMHDAFAGWGGVEQIDTGNTWLFGGRVGFETSAVTARRTSPLTIAPLSFTLDLGAQLRLSRALTAQLSYGVQYFPTLHPATSAFDPQDQLDCLDSGQDYTSKACTAVRNGYATGSAAGSYARLEHALRIGLRYEFF